MEVAREGVKVLSSLFFGCTGSSDSRRSLGFRDRIPFRFSFMLYSPGTGLREVLMQDNYVKVLGSLLVQKSSLITLRISVITTIASLILGYPLAVSWTQFPEKSRSQLASQG
jgi:hypothetical protein